VGGAAAVAAAAGSTQAVFFFLPFCMCGAACASCCFFACFFLCHDFLLISYFIYIQADYHISTHSGAKLVLPVLSHTVIPFFNMVMFGSRMNMSAVETIRELNRTMLSFLSQWARRQIPSLYIRMGPSFCVAVAVGVALSLPSCTVPILAWLLIELLWLIYFRSVLVKQLINFRPEDSGSALLLSDVDGIINHIEYLIRRDPSSFWEKVTGVSCRGSVPRNVVRCFVRSLFFMFEENTCYKEESQVLLFESALRRVEEASGKLRIISNDFDDDLNGDVPAYSNLIKSWIDDELLYDIISATPLVMVMYSEVIRRSTLAFLFLFGWRRGYIDPASHTECWTLNVTAPPISSPLQQQQQQQFSSPPLVLFPGAGFGMTSFIPLALKAQFSLRGRPIILYRFPWVEVCHPWAILPQWSVVIAGVITGLNKLGIGQDCPFDLISHSYGTAVANRLVRTLCDEVRHRETFSVSATNAKRQPPQRHKMKTRSSMTRSVFTLSEDEDKTINSYVLSSYGESNDGRGEGMKKVATDTTIPAGVVTQSSSSLLQFPRVRCLCLLDPIVLGGASTGISSFIINSVNPDMSFAFCGNRAGFGSKEVLNYDPRSAGQCQGGINVYMSAFDLLVDVDLAKYILQRHLGCNFGIEGDMRNYNNQHSISPDEHGSIHYVSVETDQSSAVRFCVDFTENSFHGRWLVEMWFLGLLWNAPCANRCYNLLKTHLHFEEASFSRSK
jgi:hypothetical protein